MPSGSRVFEFDVTVDGAGDAHSALGGSALPREAEWWAEHLVLAGLLRCTLASLDHFARRAGMTSAASGEAHGTVTKRADDLYAFVAIETRLQVELDPAPEAEATRELLERAERGCFMSNSLTARPRHHWIVNGEEVS